MGGGPLRLSEKKKKDSFVENRGHFFPAGPGDIGGVDSPVWRMPTGRPHLAAAVCAKKRPEKKDYGRSVPLKAPHPSPKY